MISLHRYQSIHDTCGQTARNFRSSSRFASCESCATASMLQDDNRCPVCRQHIERAMRLFFSWLHVSVLMRLPVAWEHCLTTVGMKMPRYGQSDNSNDWMYDKRGRHTTRKLTVILVMKFSSSGMNELLWIAPMIADWMRGAVLARRSSSNNIHISSCAIYVPFLLASLLTSFERMGCPSSLWRCWFW